MSALTSSGQSKIQKLREAFIHQLPTQLGMNWEKFDALLKDPTPKAIEEFHRVIHTLNGASAAFGLTALSSAAGEGEKLAKELLTGGVELTSSWREEMKNQLDAMERAMLTISSGNEVDLIKLDVPTAESIKSGSDRKMVYLCDDDPFQLSNLTTQIGCFGFEVRAFQNLDNFYAAVCENPPAAIIMDMLHPGNKTAGAQLVEKIRSRDGHQIPVIYTSSESDISSRLAAVRAGCDAYFVKPVNPTELCHTLDSLTNPDNSDPYRIMIIDDDQHASEVYATILDEAGMVTLSVHDPMQTISHLIEFKPDLILMDMHMPECNGMELAGVIRQMDAYLSIPIIFLSSESDLTLQFTARRMGGDEFLHKTIKPEHLVSTVAVQAQRMKLLRSYMTRDSLTGLFNHSTIKEYLELNVIQAQRSDENLCFIMIDVDHLKGINDRYGHAAGDRVLIAMANLLRQRLRKSDLIGRYGGEEFAVILSGTSMEEAVSLADNLRQCFEIIRFPFKGGFFTATFSCGVSSLSSHDDAGKLSFAAEEALRTAKSEGRNRVVAAEVLISKKQLKHIKVLVVDDSQPMREKLVHMLENMGFQNIEAAADGRQAWDKLISDKFDLVIADWHMPEMSGLELLKTIRADHIFAGIPFVMVTSEDDKLSVQEAIRAGVSEYILKPFLVEEFSNKIIRTLCKVKNVK